MSDGAIHATRGHRWFAATYDLITRWSEGKVLSPLRSSVVGDAHGTVLEIGAGTGANFPYYRRVDKLVATDPDPFMLRRAQRRAAVLGMEVEFHQCPAESLPFDDACFDTVVATLVFCTVVDPRRALAEVMRVLRPGGSFRFIEHVRAEDRLVGRVQDLLTPAWRIIGAGCHLNRRTVEAIREAGLEVVELQERSLGLQPLVCGVATPARG